MQSRDKENRKALTAGIILFGATLFSSCNFISLEQIKITSSPSAYNQVLDEDEQVWIEFSREVPREEAEQLFSLTTEDKTVAGDFFWEENRMIFRPMEPLTMATRYLLRYSGNLQSETGTQVKTDLQIPFYMSVSGGAPVLISYLPEDGADLLTADPLELTFSKSMDLESLRNGFSLDPSAEIEFALNECGTICSVFPAGVWKSHILYTWSLDEETVQDMEGLYIPLGYSGTFIIQSDRVAPLFVYYTPAIPAGSIFLDSPVLGTDDALKFNFSEEVNLISFETAFSISPSLSGHCIQSIPGTVVFVPEESFIMNTLYEIEIGEELQDMEGNRMEAPVSISLMPDIPVQEVTGIEVLGDTTVTVPSSAFLADPDGSLVIDIHDTNLTAAVTIYFGQPYDEPYRTTISSGITFHAFFPKDVSRLTNPVLENIIWANDREIQLIFSGMKKSPAADNESYLYLLAVPGGSDTSANRNGSFLEEDIWVILEAEE